MGTPGYKLLGTEHPDSVSTTNVGNELFELGDVVQAYAQLAPHLAEIDAWLAARR